MIGGVIRWFVDKKKADREENKDANSGILFCSGMIAGEGLVGILLAILAVVNVAGKIDLSGSFYNRNYWRRCINGCYDSVHPEVLTLE